MSLPAWAMAPESGARKTIVTGPCGIASRGGPTDPTRRSDTSAISSRMGVLLRQDAHREPRTPRSDLRELKEVLTSRRSCQIGRSGSNREAVPNRLSVCAYRGRGGRRFRPHGDAAHPALPAGALELAPRKPRRADAFEQIVEGSRSSGDGAETRMDGQTGHVTKAPERNPQDAPSPAGRIGRCQRLTLTHVPHQAA